LQKAFDKVPHQKLITKLKYYNLNSQVISWISSFLAGRYQGVVVDGYSSQETVVLSVVPQGTVLGPLLFLLFINNITKDISSTVRLFALIVGKSGVCQIAICCKMTSINWFTGVRSGECRSVL